MALFSLNKSGKQVSVTLLRQVPIRFDEPPRSWLGGLPMLPDDVEWPRDNEGDPLHFVAQVACADFPKQLWDGLGPRKGWLLLFVETIKLEDWNEGNIVQVLHTEELGTEREPPEDHPTVRHTMSDYIDDARPNIRRGVLPGWRKWPVDMVVQAEVPTEEASANGTPSIAPEILYDAPVSEKSFMQQGATEDVFQTDRPFSWRGALYCVEQLQRDLEPKMRHSMHRQIAVSELPRIDTTSLPDDFEAQFPQAGWIERASAAVGATLARYRTDLAASSAWLDENRERPDLSAAQKHNANLVKECRKMEESRVHLEQLAADFPGAEGEQALKKELKETATSYAQWLGQRLPLLRELHDEICDRPLDALMSDDDWESLRRRIEDPTTTIFGRTYVAGVKKDTAFHLSATHKFDFPLREDALDMYTQSRAAYAIWPAETLARFEKMARHSDTGAPHRIGGFGNPMQGEWDPSDALLFQLVSDSAMGWVWADLGALYVTMSPKDLRKGRFDRINAWMDGG